MVASHRVLMRLNAALVRSIDGSTEKLVVFGRPRDLLLPAEWQVSGRHDLDEVHEVVSLFIGMLLGVVQRIDVVVRPPTGTGPCVLLLHILDNDIAKLGTEAKLVNLVGEGMRILILEVVLEIVYVKVAVRERLSGRNMKVTDNLVDADASLKTTSFLTLLVEMFGVVFSLALFNSLSTTERPRYRSVCVANFVAGIAAAGLDCVGGGRCAVTFAAVIGSKMRRLVSMSEIVVSTPLLLESALLQSATPWRLTDPEP